MPILIPLAALLVLGQAAFDSPQEAFQRAEALYQEQQYDQAIETYQAILAASVEDGAVFYNLGNAYFKSGRLGMAILSYERALKLLPGDEDARANLAFANELIADAVAPAPLPVVVAWAVDLYRRIQPNLLAMVLSASFLLGGVFVTLLLYDAWPGLRTAAFVGLVVSAVLASVSGATLFAKVNEAANRRDAIVLSENAYVRSGPGDGNPQLAEIHEGLKLRVLGERESWLQVRLANGLAGWIRADQIEII